MRKVDVLQSGHLHNSVPGQSSRRLGGVMTPPYKGSYHFAVTVPSFFQMCFSGTVPRTQEVG